ncbi:hypothetical protein BDN72DRAFT_844941 [Pluteus cervinus]|uniref:Uncharacterized protein n=1 Tax=Pluteus cervinus TaxID=181527 RepID=A0ACD3AJN7_9AGAR|nr:hypothetical protein BDN72DRAFT_844941 [Pluteus cervinus]
MLSPLSVFMLLAVSLIRLAFRSTPSQDESLSQSPQILHQRVTPNSKPTSRTSGIFYVTLLALLAAKKIQVAGKLRDIVFAWTLPKIQHRLNRFGDEFTVWLSVLEECMAEENRAQMLPSDELMAELAREISKAIKALDITKDGNESHYSEV